MSVPQKERGKVGLANRLLHALLAQCNQQLLDSAVHSQL